MLDGYMKVDYILERLISIDHQGAAGQFFCEIPGTDYNQQGVLQ